MNKTGTTGGAPVRQAIEIATNLLLIFLLMAWCLRIMAPFITFIVWGMIIAISVYTPFCSLRNRIGSKGAVTVFTALGLATVLVPAYLFASSLFDSAGDFYASVASGEFDIPPPDAKVAEWPVVGAKLYAAWSTAAENFEAFLEQYSSGLDRLAEFALARAKGVGLSILLFVAATFVAALMLAKDEAAVRALKRFCRRLMGEHGDAFLDLSVATIRSVTVGVLGIAFIQAVGTGLGMWLVGVPGTGVWALLVLILVIAQLPALIVMLPVILWVFSSEPTGTAVIFAVWSVAVSMSDMVLKPVLLGRGADAPMVVILLGAIGGMVLHGIIGLFVGAVVLALGYKLFMLWLILGEEPAPPDAEAPAKGEAP